MVTKLFSIKKLKDGNMEQDETKGFKVLTNQNKDIAKAK
jgi:hypothetical protein